VCTADTGTPRYDALLADGRITIAAVFGELAGGPADYNAWSYRAAANGLRARGFTEVDAERYRLGNITVDLALIADDPAQTSAALAGALASHDVVYYNGHSHAGAIALSPPSDYRIIMLDSCWSTQHYAAGLVGPGRDVITNTDRSITGSVESLLMVVDTLRARGDWPIGELNTRAQERARLRAPLSRFKDPEHYRRDVECR
jgi:hypothetical protein